jgi:hypothetical protein
MDETVQITARGKQANINNLWVQMRPLKSLEDLCNFVGSLRLSCLWAWSL